MKIVCPLVILLVLFGGYPRGYADRYVPKRHRYVSEYQHDATSNRTIGIRGNARVKKESVIVFRGARVARSFTLPETKSAELRDVRQNQVILARERADGSCAYTEVSLRTGVWRDRMVFTPSLDRDQTQKCYAYKSEVSENGDLLVVQDHFDRDGNKNRLYVDSVHGESNAIIVNPLSLDLSPGEELVVNILADGGVVWNAPSFVSSRYLGYWRPSETASKVIDMEAIIVPTPSITTSFTYYYEVVNHNELILRAYYDDEDSNQIQKLIGYTPATGEVRTVTERELAEIHRRADKIGGFLDFDTLMCSIRRSGSPSFQELQNVIRLTKGNGFSNRFYYKRIRTDLDNPYCPLVKIRALGSCVRLFPNAADGSLGVPETDRAQPIHECEFEVKVARADRAPIGPANLRIDDAFNNGASFPLNRDDSATFRIQIDTRDLCIGPILSGLYGHPELRSIYEYLWSDRCP